MTYVIYATSFDDDRHLTAEDVMSNSLGTALITGASSGIGAIYADRLAQRGYDLVLVARDEARLNALAARRNAETRVSVEVLRADLTRVDDLAKVEARLGNGDITLLVNNAGMAAPGGFSDADPAILDTLLQLNIVAVTRLASAAVKAFLPQGRGAIVNISSVLGLAPEISFGAYGATKSYVLTLSQSLQVEVGPKGIYVQAVLPAATRTEIWQRSGRDITQIQGVMDADELVDAALVGFDRRETITIPPLPDATQWDAFNAARVAMMPNFRQEHAAARYRAA
jgi:short-subunit dehydrogenase